MPVVGAPSFAEGPRAIRGVRFDTLGHMDMCKRWLVPWFKAADFAAAPELYEPLLIALAASGTALEVNASGLRHPTGETYPGPWVVARFRELGGQRVTVGSDPHMPHTFAFGIEEAGEIGAAAGFDRVAAQGAVDRRAPRGTPAPAVWHGARCSPWRFCGRDVSRLGCDYSAACW